jgi:hypothetical protein
MPAYVPPRPSDFTASIDNKLSAEVSRRLKIAADAGHGSRGNFVVNNIKRLKPRSGGI